MLQHINAIWIMHHGKIILERGPENPDDEKYISGLLNALNECAELLNPSPNVSHFEICSKRYYIIRNRDYIGVGSSSLEGGINAAFKEMHHLLNGYILGQNSKRMEKQQAEQ